MSNLSIQTLLNATSSNSNPRTGRTEADPIDRNDPASAFDQVMQRHGTRESPPRSSEPQRARSVEPARPAPRTPPADDARPAERAVKRDSDGVAPSPRNERSDPVDDAGTTPPATNTRMAASAPATDEAATAAAPDSATGDLFADLRLALTAPDKTAAAPATALPVSALPLTDTGADLNDAVSARPVAVAPALAPTVDSSTRPVLRSSPLDETGTDAVSTRPTPRAPRVVDGRAGGATASKEARDPAQQLLPIDVRPAEPAAESGFAGLAAALDVRGPAARAEPHASTPLSLSAALATSPVNTPATYTIAHTQVGTAVGERGFGDDFSQRVMMLAGQRVQFAEIALTPADLGPISVTVDVRGQDASLVFGAAQSATRLAIEDALPRLREMFQAHGLHLVDAHVGAQLGHHGRRDGAATDAERGRSGSRAAFGPAHTSAATESVVQVHSNRLIDVRV